jgi:hypothetical protein
MAKVITFSRTFPAYHPKKGQPTQFVEKFIESTSPKNYSPKGVYLELEYLNEQVSIDVLDEFSRSLVFLQDKKHHTIRSGKRFKKGDYFSPRVWSGKPYNSKQIVIAPDTLITDVWDFKIEGGVFFINKYKVEFESILYDLSHNDGLVRADLFAWFQYPKDFRGQIICWNDTIKY